MSFDERTDPDPKRSPDIVQELPAALYAAVREVGSWPGHHVSVDRFGKVFKIEVEVP